MSQILVTKENWPKKKEEIGPLLKAMRFAVAVTGAGISKASGIPLFKERIDGIPLQQFFKSEFLNSDPVHYYRLYRRILAQWRRAKPNAAHWALSKRGIWVVTQNIDGLHRDAGTRHLIELHGNLRELQCPTCKQVYQSDLAFAAKVPVCPDCDGLLMPGVTLEGQQIRHFSRAVDWCGRAQVLFVVGSKLNMEPVRQLPEIAESNGAVVVFINQDAEHALPGLLEEHPRPTKGRTADV